MAVGLSELHALSPVEGVRLGTCEAGLRYPHRRDLVVIELAASTHTAVVFTRNRFCAAPVTVARKHLAQAAPRALLINTGYANAGMGDVGIQDALACCQALAERMGCRPEQVLPFSTGVVGERLPVDRLVTALPTCLKDRSESGWTDAAHGIMTTDTIAKGVSKQFQIGSTKLVLTGIAKGAGMICPNMATMLVFLATNAAVQRDVLQACLEQSVAQSFNRITVDGDTSTNDACVLLATGQAGRHVEEVSTDAFVTLLNAVSEVCMELAHAIVRDAEGATKFVTIDVSEGTSEADCLTVAYTIAHSPLVKTALFASDPNWGRILAAVGRAAVDMLKLDTVSIYLDDVCVVRQGALADDYTEVKGQEVVRKPEIAIRVTLGAGSQRACIWTSDLSHEYVRINAEYRS